MKLVLDITPEEYCAMRAKAAMAGVGVRDVVTQMIADMVASPRSGGSDERELAQAWLERSYNMTPDYDAEDASRDSVMRCRRAVRWRKAAVAMRKREEICSEA